MAPVSYTHLANYNITPWLLLVPVIVIVLIALKVPAIPGLFAGTVLGMICGVVFQHQDLSIVFNAVQNGVVVETGHAMVDELLTRGGLMSMMWTVSLIICAMSFGGILECTGTVSYTHLDTRKYGWPSIRMVMLFLYFSRIAGNPEASSSARSNMEIFTSVPFCLISRT